MKIYTEINYKWLDGQLVKIDSKSFEYDGEVSLCMSGVVAGLGQAATGIGNTVSGTAQGSAQGLQTTASDVSGGVEAGVEGATETLNTVLTETEAGLEVATDPLEGTGQIIDDFVDSTTTTVVDPIIHATDQVTTGLAEGLSTGMDAIGEEGGRVGQGALTTLEPLQIGGTTKDLLDKFEDTVGSGLSGLTTSINDGLGYLTPSGGGGGKVELEKMKSRKGKLKNKNIANLKVNKSKGRARKSLRIG